MPLPHDSQSDQERAALRAFHALLDGHPSIDDELIADPRLLEDPRWLERQPRVTALFARHPGLPGTLRTARHVFRWREVQRALRPVVPAATATSPSAVRPA
jgi:hypothetical protein